MIQQMYLIAGNPGVKIDELHVQAKIVLDDAETMNRATVTITNAGPATLGAIFASDAALMQVFYGRGTDLSDAGLGYLGDITSMTPKPGRVTNQYIIECGEKKNTLADAQTIASFGSAVSVEQYLDRCARDLGMSDAERKTFRDSLPARVRNEKAHIRRSASPTRNVLSGLARAHKFDWMYIDGKLTVLDRDTPTEMPAIVLNPDTGLLGTPVFVQDGKKKGWRIQARPQIGMLPRRLVSVESSSFTGLLMLKQNETNIDKRGQPWKADLFAQEI